MEFEWKIEEGRMEEMEWKEGRKEWKEMENAWWSMDKTRWPDQIRNPRNRSSGVALIAENDAPERHPAWRRRQSSFEKQAPRLSTLPSVQRRFRGVLNHLQIALKPDCLCLLDSDSLPELPLNSYRACSLSCSFDLVLARIRSRTSPAPRPLDPVGSSLTP